jgi:hypothetical protein
MRLVGVVSVVWTAALAGESWAVSPACFSERTVLWAAALYDDQDRQIGGVRAGHTVRVLEDFTGPKKAMALVEVDEPFRVRGLVDRRMLVAFLRQEMPTRGGFATWVKGAPMIVGETVGPTKVGLSLADPHKKVYRRPEATAGCTAIQGRPSKITRRDGCQGAYTETDATTHGDRRVFWEKEVTLRSLDGRHRLTLEEEEWVYLVEERRRRVVVELRDGKVLFIGTVGRKGMQFVPDNLEMGVGHLGCHGIIPEDPLFPRAEGREAEILSSTSIAAVPGGSPTATLPAGLRVRRLREDGDVALVIYQWPTWDHASFTFEIHGWVSKSQLK